MKSDFDLKQDVLNRLELEPKIDLDDLLVSVEDGVVTLRGSVHSEAEKATTEHALKAIKGVKGLVADELKVPASKGSQRSDAEISTAATEAIEWLTTIPRDRMQVTVRNGWLELEGRVEWQHQAETIEEVLRDVPGVRGVCNRLVVQGSS